MDKKIIVTAALPYVNNVPHLGNLIPTLSADVYARYLRLRGEDVIYVCGVDEHGTTTETKALEEGLTPQQVCDKYFKLHSEIYEWFNIKFDCFGRTGSKENKLLVTEIFNKLDENGYLTSDILDQTYCNNCKKFLADRFVEGTCPHCDYEHARGDQCERCGKLLDAKDLKNAKCKICKSTPEIRKSKHLFIDLPRLAPDLKKWIGEVSANWSENALTMTQAWLREGLKPRCITRDLKWGIPVPKKGYEDKVFYVWFDAPIGYMGITAEFHKDWRERWQKSKLVQFMGKDNIPFHTIMFPSFLIGTKDQWTLVEELSVNEYLNYEGGMFSKSRGIGVFGDKVKESGIKADIWRYYLTINRPEKQDTDFTWEDFNVKINNELVANLGNLVYRNLSFLNRYYDSKLNEIQITEEDEKFIDEVEKTEEKIRVLFDEIKLKDALKETLHIARLGNQYFQKSEPWKTVKLNPERAQTALTILTNVIKDLSILLEPFMPDTAKDIQLQLKIKDELNWNDLGLKTLQEGHKIAKAEILFKKMEEEELEGLKNQYGANKKIFPLDLKVAEIKDVQDHPKADKLYVLKIDTGKEKQLVGGLKNYYTKDQLIGKKIVIVDNLAPAKLRGVESQGMLLAASKLDKKTEQEKVKVLEASNSKPGEQVRIEGYTIGKDQIKYDEFKKLKLHIKDQKVLYKRKVLKTSSENVTAEIEDGAHVS